MRAVIWSRLKWVIKTMSAGVRGIYRVHDVVPCGGDGSDVWGIQGH